MFNREKWKEVETRVEKKNAFCFSASHDAFFVSFFIWYVLLLLCSLRAYVYLISLLCCSLPIGGGVGHWGRVALWADGMLENDEKIVCF